MNKTAHLHLRISPEQKARYTQAAANVGATLSEWVLDVLEDRVLAQEALRQQILRALNE